MKVILSNGVELAPYMITGSKKTIQGAMRDTLSFVFPETVGMDAIDAAFSEVACESITIINDSNEEFIHKGYTIRAELNKTPMEVVPATEEADAVVENRITVSMSQRTYAETQLAALTETVDILVMESLMA